MNQSWREALLAKRFDGYLKFFELLFREVLFAFVVRDREMGHQAVNSNVREISLRIAEFRNAIGAHTEATHAGIDLDVNIGDCISIAGRAIERLNHVEPVNNRRQLVLQTD